MMGSDVSSTVSDPQGKILDSIFLDVFQEKVGEAGDGGRFAGLSKNRQGRFMMRLQRHAQ